jgi:hypothetical protein
MKTIIFLLLLISMNAFAQISPWTGRFDGTIIGINASISATVNGTQWNADVNASGYPLTLSGGINGNACTGTMNDPSTGAESPFTATLDGSRLIIGIRDINPVSGLEEDMQFTFMRSGDAVPSSSFTPAARDENIDERLVGTWRFTEAYVSGDFSVATDFLLQFNEDGTMYATDGRSAGGDANSSIVSGDPDVHEAQWKTENKTLYVNDGTGWQAYASYFAEEYRMMLTYNNGKKQVWERL